MELYQEALETFRTLFEEAKRSGEPEPTAMTLATGANARISARIVLLKSVDERGFVFFTNYESDKARQIAAQSQVALCFLWKTMREGMQVRIEGAVERTSAEESDAYFATRARDSQIGAWASKQSHTLRDRAEFEARIAEIEAKFDGGAVPRPPHWGGYRVVPYLLEFWYGQKFRLHDRVRYERSGNAWSKRLLYP